MAAPKIQRKKFNAEYLEIEFNIAAPKARVWRTLIKETSTWWPTDFTAGKSTKRMVLEPRIGGRLYEDWGRGNGLTWYTVQSMDTPNMIEFLGRMSKDFGGPAMQIVEFRLESVGKRTTLRLIDTVFGATDKKLKSNLHGGWTKLIGGAFKKYAESSK